MKKTIAVLCLLLCAAIAFPMTATAAQVPFTSPEAQVTAVVSLTDGGEVTLDEAPETALMDAALGYDLYIEAEPVLTVEHLFAGVGDHVEAPRFYSVDFTLPGTATEVFLTGLTAASVDEVQQRLIAGYVDGENFELTDLDFIDAEKTYNEDADDELCWAASCSDMLVYTGWAALAGFESEDDVFESFISAFSNYGGHAVYGLGWFFNGVSLNADAARILDYPNSGGYLADYAFERVFENGYLTVDHMDEIASKLREGWAIGLGAYLYYQGEEDGGHAITLWGYVLDRSMDADDPARYRAVFITDSDSHELPDVDRREAQDVMGLYALGVSGDYYYFDYDAYESALIYDYSALMPYSEAAEREEGTAVLRDKINYPDLSVTKLFLSDTNNSSVLNTLFESGTDLYFSCRFLNYADKAYQANFRVRMAVTDADGNDVYNNERGYSINMSVRGIASLPFQTTAGLAAGDYTLTVTLNEDPTASGIPTEGYYYNNTMSVDFKVRDSYLVGDYDGNGEINIIDATRIQRALAGFTSTADENAAIRGNISGREMSIIDATLVQRYIAGFTMSCPVGEKQLYD